MADVSESDSESDGPPPLAEDDGSSDQAKKTKGEGKRETSSSDEWTDNEDALEFVPLLDEKEFMGAVMETKKKMARQNAQKNQMQRKKEKEAKKKTLKHASSSST